MTAHLCISRSLAWQQLRKVHLVELARLWGYKTDIWYAAAARYAADSEQPLSLPVYR